MLWINKYTLSCTQLRECIYICSYTDDILVIIATCDCLILKVKNHEFLRAPVRSHGTVSAFWRDYLAMSRELNVQENRKMNEKVIEVLGKIFNLWKRYQFVTGNELLKDPVSSCCLLSIFFASIGNLCHSHFPFPACFILQWKWGIWYKLMA